jgi:hypothetical protein
VCLRDQVGGVRKAHPLEGNGSCTQNDISPGGGRSGRPHGTEGRGGGEGARPLHHHQLSVQAIIGAWKGEL